MIVYTLNGINITPYVDEHPKIYAYRGTEEEFSPNRLSLSVHNEAFSLSPRIGDAGLIDEEEYLMQKVSLMMFDDQTNEIYWDGIVQTLSRNDEQKISIESTEAIVAALQVATSAYHPLDGFTNDKAYAGDLQPPALHQLAFVRRFVPEHAIDDASFKNVALRQTELGIMVNCRVYYTDNQKPASVLAELCMGVASLSLKGNRISCYMHEETTGFRGILLTDDVIISIDEKSYTTPEGTYSQYAITDASGTTQTGSIGRRGSGANLSTDALIISDASFTPGELVGQYVLVTTPGGESGLFYISDNTTTTLRITNDTLEATSDCIYTIMPDNRVYAKEYTLTDKIILHSGADALGVSVLTRNNTPRRTVTITIMLLYLEPGDIITLHYPNEDIFYQPFIIESLRKDIISGISELVVKAIGESVEETFDPINLTGTRNGTEAYLSWNSVVGVSYYIVQYGTSSVYVQDQVITTDIMCTLTQIPGWLGYYVWVIGVGYSGIRTPRSNVLFLERVQFESGYIDGTTGYHLEHYANWGILEDYTYLITYKTITAADIPYLAKSNLVIVDRSQKNSSQDISQAWVNEELASTKKNLVFRGLGYVDCAGISSNLHEYTDHQVKNPLPVMLRIGDTLCAAGEIIPDSDQWFLRDGYDQYYSFWYGVGFMLDPAHQAQREWFLTWKINRTMGCFEYAYGTLTGNEFISTVHGKYTGWIVNQWRGYYVYFPKISTANGYVKQWYRIAGNTLDTLILAEIPKDINFVIKSGPDCIINDVPHKSFDGIFLDDVWDTLYQGLLDKGSGDEGTADWVGESWVTDFSKNWDSGELVGLYVTFDNGEHWHRVNYNSSTTFTFDDENTIIGAELPYRIASRFEMEHGITYAEALAYFLGGNALRPVSYPVWGRFDGSEWQGIITYIEELSFVLTGSYIKASQGIVCVNTWCVDWTTNYQRIVEAITRNYNHFVMMEAVQATWVMDNEVTRQYRIIDWPETIKRFTEMKQANSMGRYVRILMLSYPHSRQMERATIAGALLLTHASSTSVADLVSCSNIVLKELYYDLSQARNNEYITTENGYIYKNTGKTIGLPTASRSVDPYDPYAVVYREFEGATVFLNPTRKITMVSYDFTEPAVELATGRAFSAARESFFILPRSSQFFYKDNIIGRAAADYLSYAQLFSYVDTNAAWIVFTPAGAITVGGNSVWIQNGHSAYKHFTIDSNVDVPVGVPWKLFHAGNGSSSAFTGHDAETEIITVTDNSLVLTDLTIYAVIEVWSEARNRALVLGEAGEYLVEYGSSDNTPSGKGTWHTYIHLLCDCLNENLTVKYFSQGMDSAGYPCSEGYAVEHGILYREDDFALVTGGINEADCADELVEGLDYYVIPELTRYTWQYRLTRDCAISTSLSFNTKDILYDSTNPTKHALQWGTIDVENMILVDPTQSHPYACNGYKANYASKTIKKPRLLVYGFCEDPRDDDFQSYEIPDRSYNPWRIENKLKELEGIDYDLVVITGWYDGKEGRPSGGEWGSVAGYMAAEGIMTYEELALRFDVLIICDNFMEGSVSPEDDPYFVGPSGRKSYASWLNQGDYDFLRVFADQEHTLIIDRRFGATAFLWYAQVIGQSLYNNGGYCHAAGVYYQRNDDVSYIFGVLYYAGVNFRDLASAEHDIYLDENGTRKFNSENTLDLRVFNAVPGITDHYALPADDSNAYFNRDDLPVYNSFEQGGAYLTYVPRSSYAVELSPSKRIPEYKLYLKTYAFTETSLSSYLSYEKMDEGNRVNIIYRKDPVVVYHRQSEDVGLYMPLTYGNQLSENGADFLLIRNTEEFIAVPLRYDFQTLDPEIWGVRKIRFTDQPFTFDELTYPHFEGYQGHYMFIKPSDEVEDGFGALKNLKADQEEGGGRWYFFDETRQIQWGNIIMFNNWCGSVEDRYLISILDERDGETGFVPAVKPCKLYQYWGIVTGVEGGLLAITIGEPINLYDPGKPHSAWFLLSRRSPGGLIDPARPDVTLDCARCTVAHINYESRTVFINLDRAYRDDGTGELLAIPALTEICGYLVLCEEPDENESSDGSTETVSEQNQLGGYYSTVEVADSFFYIGEETDPARIEGISEPRSIIKWEKLYADRIDEFAYEHTTGLCTGYVFDRREKGKTVVWSGVSLEDIMLMIEKNIGTTITFHNVVIPSPRTLHLYYNSASDMLDIREANVGRPYEWPFRFEDFTKEEIITNIRSD